MSGALTRALVRRGIVMFTCVPVILAMWAIPAYVYKWNVVNTKLNLDKRWRT